MPRRFRTDHRKIINHRPEKVRKSLETQNRVSLSGDGSSWVYIIIIAPVQGLQQHVLPAVSVRPVAIGAGARQRAVYITHSQRIYGVIVLRGKIFTFITHPPGLFTGNCCSFRF